VTKKWGKVRTGFRDCRDREWECSMVIVLQSVLAVDIVLDRVCEKDILMIWIKQNNGYNKHYWPD